MEFPDNNRSNSDDEENDVNSSMQENLNWFKSSLTGLNPPPVL